MSIQDIQQNPQETSNFYLANIYQTLADPSRSSSLPAFPLPFSPPVFTVWVNALWFLSLVISLTCALLATLLQQWARRYLRATQSRYSPHKRARIRAFFSEGVEKHLLPSTVEILPTLLHISLFLFFAGLVVFLWNVNLTIFKLVFSWVGVCTALYGCITVIPILRHDSPYHTPLSSPAWRIITGISFLTFRVLQWFTEFVCASDAAYDRFRGLEKGYRKLLVQGMQKTAEETGLNLPSEIDIRAFLWTFDRLDEDHELERFFSGLPGFRSSKVFVDPLPSLAEEAKQRLFDALIGLLDRTFSSDFLPESDQNRRAIICAKAIAPVDIPDAYRWILTKIIDADQHSGLCTAQFGHILRGWADNLGGDQHASMAVKATLNGIIAKAQRRNDSWFIITSHELGIPEAVLRDYATHGNSLSLAVLIHVTRQQFNHHIEAFWPSGHFGEVLSAASKFDVQDTSPELRTEFCALWNQIVRTAQKDNSWWTTFHILGRIRNVYLALHQGTNSAPTQFSASTSDGDIILEQPSSYLPCNTPSHHPGSTPHVRDRFSIARAVSYFPQSTVTGPTFLSSVPDTPSLSTQALLRVDETLTVSQWPDDSMSVPVFPEPIDQKTIGSGRFPATSLNPVTTRATHRSIDTFARTMHLSTLEPSASTSAPKSKASTSPPDPVTVEYTSDPSDDLDVP